jgi:tight adherence protein C
MPRVRTPSLTLSAAWQRQTNRLGGRVAEVLPETWVRGLAGRLAAVGQDRPAHLRRGLAVRVMAVAVGVALGGVVGAGTSTPGGLSPAVGLLVGLLVAALPELHLRRRSKKRQRVMRRHLPRLLDLMVISVESGLGFDPALSRAARTVPPPLSTEFSRLQAEILAGVPRVEALRALAARCPFEEMRSFALAVAQVESFGIPIGPTLRTQADELRVRQRQMAQERAQKAPVKMLAPLVICVFPALLVVVAGPAILSIRSTFAG